jgi:methylase of polypeptide subunit release factors
VLRLLFRRLLRSRALAARLLGLELPALEDGEHYLDVTTLALLRAARGRVPRGSRVLDVGTGSFAAIGIWLERRLGCEVVATEVDPQVAERARRCVQLNRAGVRVVEGDLLAGLEGPFDHVLCNPPYVPTAPGVAQGLPQRLRSQWDGGPDGSETIARFLAAFEREGRRATALLGVNSRHVPRARVLERIGERTGLELVELVPGAWLPADVYVLVTRKGPSASASRPEA